jgi:hypothetical protein
MKCISKSSRQAVWFTERGVVELLQVSSDVSSKIFPSFNCIMTLNADKGTVTIDGDNATDAGRWFERIVAKVKVDKPLQSPVFIAAMRLRDVAREVASTLKSIPASCELIEGELIVYAWQRLDLQKPSQLFTIS